MTELVGGAADQVSNALMHLFYYQQGCFADEVDAGLLREVAAAPGSQPWRSPSSASAGGGAAPMQQPLHPLLQGSLASMDESVTTTTGVGSSSSCSSASSVIRGLRERRSELQWRLEAGALQAENEALESQVLRMQEDFIALQDEFKDMKESFGEKLSSLDKALEAQQAITVAAEKRVICTEDLVRFYEEQRRLMAGHWKAQCLMKDERIRYLNLQLTEYTIDWQHLGAQKQTEASLSHELQCLQDRHGELLADFERRKVRKELCVKLSEVQAEVAELREAEEAAESRAIQALERRAAAAKPADETAARADQRRVHTCAATEAGLRARLDVLQQWRTRREQETLPADPPWPHSCIWRDELDVREGQLEKITAQLDRTNNALHVAQAALQQQRVRHEDMKSQHREAEAELREGERRRARGQRQCAELKRAEQELRRMLESSAASLVAGGGAAGNPGGLNAEGMTGGAGSGGGGATRADALHREERIAAISRETQRLVALRRGVPPPVPHADPQGDADGQHAGSSEQAARPAGEGEPCAGSGGAPEAAASERHCRADDAARVAPSPCASPTDGTADSHIPVDGSALLPNAALIPRDSSSRSFVYAHPIGRSP